MIRSFVAETRQQRQEATAGAARGGQFSVGGGFSGSLAALPILVQEVPTTPGATARSADATTSPWPNAMADRNVPRPAQGGTEQSH